MQLYDRESGRVLAAAKAHLGGTAVSRVLLSPSASELLTVGEDGSLRLWAVPPAAALRSQVEQQVRWESLLPDPRVLSAAVA